MWLFFFFFPSLQPRQSLKRERKGKELFQELSLLHAVFQITLKQHIQTDYFHTNLGG